MLHCPYCGGRVKEDETYCIVCGKHLPTDITNRRHNKKTFQKIWYFPFSMLLLFLVASGAYYLFLQNQTVQAKEQYEQGEKSLANGNYQEAEDYFNQALSYKRNFPQVEIASNYVDIATTIKAALQEAEEELLQENFQEALALINGAESNIKHYTGSIVADLVNDVIAFRNTIKIEQLKKLLVQGPTIDELKVLLWDADAIKTNDAEAITTDIRNQIIDFTFSNASDQLNKKQFNDALSFVIDGLKYAPESEKLQSLKTTIEKEKFAFETTQQQRLEQAISTAEEEKDVNENDAIQLVNVEVMNDDQGNIVISGEVKSVATIPINSVQVNYSLSAKGKKDFLSNEIYVFPDTLYPNETGKFEFTHFDLNDDRKNIDVNVSKITWYTN